MEFTFNSKSITEVLNDAYEATTKGVSDAYEATTKGVSDAYEATTKGVSDAYEATAKRVDRAFDSTGGLNIEELQTVKKHVSATKPVILPLVGAAYFGTVVGVAAASVATATTVGVVGSVVAGACLGYWVGYGLSSDFTDFVVSMMPDATPPSRVSGIVVDVVAKDVPKGSA